MKRFAFKDRMKSFVFAGNGLKILFREEHNARIHLVATVLVILAGIYFEISPSDWIAVSLCVGLVYITEIFNTAIEHLCNFVSPEKREVIGKIKDLSAAAVLVSALVSVVVAILILT